MKNTYLPILALLSLTLLFGCENGTTNPPVSSTDVATANPPIKYALTKPLESPNAKYALLVTDVVASEKFWLGAIEDTVYVDRNSDGEFSSDEKIVSESPNSQTVFRLGKLGFGTYELSLETTGLQKELKRLQPGFVEGQLDNGWSLAKINRVDNQDAFAIPVWLTSKIDQSKIAHLTGRLEFGLKTSELTMAKDQETKFAIRAVVNQLLDRESNKRAAAPIFTREIGNPVSPVARFEFASNDPNADSIEKLVTLDQRC